MVDFSDRNRRDSVRRVITGGLPIGFLMADPGVALEEEPVIKAKRELLQGYPDGRMNLRAWGRDLDPGLRVQVIRESRIELLNILKDRVEPGPPKKYIGSPCNALDAIRLVDELPPGEAFSVYRSYAEEAVKSGSTLHWRTAAEVIQRLPCGGAEALPILRRLLDKGPNPYLRMAAIDPLCELGSEFEPDSFSKQIIIRSRTQDLLRIAKVRLDKYGSLASGDEFWGKRALKLIGELPPSEAFSAYSAYVEASMQPNARFHPDLASQAISGLSLGGEQALPLLERILVDGPNADFRVSALNPIFELGPIAAGLRHALPALIARDSTTAGWVGTRQKVLSIFGQFGPAAADCAPILVAEIESGNGDMRDEFVTRSWQSLWDIGLAAASFVDRQRLERIAGASPHPNYFQELIKKLWGEPSES